MTSSRTPDEVLGFAGMDDVDPEGVEPMFTMTAVLCEVEPLVSVMVTV